MVDNLQKIIYTPLATENQTIVGLKGLSPLRFSPFCEVLATENQTIVGLKVVLSCHLANCT